jgi:hypothetical protein
MLTLAIVLLLAAVGGLVAIAAQHAILRAHVRQAPPVPSRSPPVSILKPLCGLDDGLEANLASFASLDHPDYEVLLGLRSADDPAFGIARWAARRWPRRFRVVLQRGEPGLNPKVNQLVTLARAARHDVLVVSDSNVRVERAYLSEIVAHLEDDGVGLVTHPIAGVGETRLGSLMDHLHLAGSVTPGVLARAARRSRPAKAWPPEGARSAARIEALGEPPAASALLEAERRARRAEPGGAVVDAGEAEGAGAGVLAERDEHRHLSRLAEELAQRAGHPR